MTTHKPRRLRWLASIALLYALATTAVQAESLFRFSFAHDPATSPFVHSRQNTVGFFDTNNFQPSATASVEFLESQLLGRIGSGLIFTRRGQSANVIEGRSAAGAGWQTSFLSRPAGQNSIYVNNQASGNSVGFSWGYSNATSVPQWNTLWADTRLSDFTGTRTFLCPCDAFPRYAVKRGLPSTRWDRIWTAPDANGFRGGVIRQRNHYDLASLSGTFDASFFALEQAFYLDRRVAMEHNLRIFFKYRNQSQPREANFSVLEPSIPWLTPNSARTHNEALNNAVLVDTIRGLNRDALSQRINGLTDYVIDRSIQYVVFVWQVDDFPLAVAIDMPTGSGFNGGNMRIERRPYCTDTSDPSCGNLNWHTWIDNSFREGRSNTRFTAAARRYQLDYYIGLPQHLAQLGFVSDSRYALNHAPQIDDDIIPLILPLLLKRRD
ncbi:hypothetical protein OAS86_06225 [Gammaproteobacteria bacterium]|nr:hypothetical protein [Gammaproteobacteria bacterium]